MEKGLETSPQELSPGHCNKTTSGAPVASPSGSGAQDSTDFAEETVQKVELRSSESGLKRRLAEGAVSEEVEATAKKPRLMAISDGVAPEPSTPGPEPPQNNSLGTSAKRKVSHGISDNPGSEDEAQIADEPKTKKPKIDLDSLPLNNPTEDETHDPNITPAPPPITLLPLDILAEILQYIRDPTDLLAVARTCKALCIQLLSPDANFIWKKMNTAIGLPDPSAFDGEMPSEGEKRNGPGASVVGVKYFVGRDAAYAAFVFDSGTCESCGGPVKNMYISFALRLRSCGSISCSSTTRTALVDMTSHDDSKIWWTVPVMERSPLLTQSALQSQCWPHGQKTSRAELVTAASQKYSSFPKNAECVIYAVLRNIVWMKFCVALSRWKTAWHKKIHHVEIANRATGTSFAAHEGWDYSNMCTSTVYGDFLKKKLKLHEMMTTEELKLLRPKIAKELYALQEKRDKKAMIKLRDANRNSLWKTYHSLASNRVHYPIIPSFSTFLKLPALEFLQSSQSTTAKVELKNIFKGSFVPDMVKHQVNQWVEQAKSELLESLGCGQEWNVMVPARQMPHPALRLEARWQCQVCHEVGEKYRMDECLDFAGVCRHECRENKARKHRKGTAKVWCASNFVRDDKAYSVLKTCLDRLECPIEDPAYISRSFKQANWLCKSCSPPLFVRAESLVGHSHRHPMPMEVELVPRDVAVAIRPRRNLSGLTHWLLRSNKKSREWIEKLIYGCVHCSNVKELDDRSQIQERDDNPDVRAITEETLDPEKIGVDVDAKQHDRNMTKGKASNRFHFNGLRSHLKLKHNIQRIRDEDYFCYERVTPFTNLEQELRDRQ